MAWLCHNAKDAAREFSRKLHCDLALAKDHLKVVGGIRNQQPFCVTDEDGKEARKYVIISQLIRSNYAPFLGGHSRPGLLHHFLEFLSRFLQPIPLLLLFEDFVSISMLICTTGFLKTN